MPYFTVSYTLTNNAKAAWDSWYTDNLADHELECMRSAMHVAEDREYVRTMLFFFTNIDLEMEVHEFLLTVAIFAN